MEWTKRVAIRNSRFKKEIKKIRLFEADEVSRILVNLILPEEYDEDGSQHDDPDEIKKSLDSI